MLDRNASANAVTLGTGVLLAAALLAGCGAVPAERSVAGVTDSTVAIGSWAPLSGPAAAWGAIGRGMEAYFKLVNEEGGIHGRHIRFVLKDDQYQPARTVAAVRELVEREQVFALVGGTGTAPAMAVRDYLARAGVPLYGLLTGAHHFTHPPQEYLFGGIPLYVHEAAVLVDHAVAELGLRRVGLLYQNDDFGRSGLAGAEVALERHGLEPAVAASVEVIDSDLSAQALRLRQSGADAVLLFVTPRHASIILRETARIGFRPQWLGSLVLADAELLDQLSDGLWRGAIFAASADQPSHESPAMARFRDAWQRHAPEERGGYFLITGMSVADALVEALRRAGRELTRERLIAALEELEGYRNIGAPISYAGNRRHGARALRIDRIDEAGAVENLTDWMIPDLDPALAARRLEARR